MLLPTRSAPVPGPADGDLLVIRGGRPLVGSVAVVGDKSVSHRALLFSALADGITRVDGLSPARDVRRSLEAMRALGVAIELEAPTRALVHGVGPRGLSGPPVEIDCGDSGTTMRLLAGLLAGQDRAFRLTGSEGLSRRPMRRVIEPLQRMGARIEAERGDENEGDLPPLRGRGGPLLGREIRLERASAQVGSALLLAGLNAEGETRVAYPSPVRDHTERMLADMGAPLRWDGRETVLDGPVETLRPAAGGALVVPGDPSGAAFLLAAAAIVPGSHIRALGIGVNPGRTGFFEILEAMGAPVRESGLRAEGAEPVADLETRFAEAGLRAGAFGGQTVPRAIDELPLVAVLGAFASGRSELHDAAELRVKESDRIAAICEGLKRMGAKVEERSDGFVVDGLGEDAGEDLPRSSRLRGAELDGHGDHRIVMALAVAALAADGETLIRGAGAIADSFPGFIEILKALGADLELQA